MLQTLRRRLQGEREGGFTLIELMVVVLIIAILIAIAIPTFLGARTRAQNRAVQANLRNALTVEKSVYTDAQAYSSDVTATGAALDVRDHRLDIQIVLAIEVVQLGCDASDFQALVVEPEHGCRDLF